MFCKCNGKRKNYPLAGWRIIRHEYTPKHYIRIKCLRCGCVWITRAKTIILTNKKSNESMKFELKDICFFDCETTGVPAKGLKWDADFNQFPHVVQLAWAFGDKERSFIIKPDNYEIPPETTAIHGITTERAIDEGVPFAEVIDEFLADAAAAPLVCAHNIYFDTSMLKANILRYCGKEYYDAKAEDALHKGKRIDTMMKTIKFVGALYQNGKPGKFPKLEELFAKLFPGETFPAHEALQDVKALRRCVPELVELGIIELKQKEYPAEKLKAKFEPEKPGNGGIEFYDHNPVTEPIGTGNPKREPVPEPEPIPEPQRPAVARNKTTKDLLDETDF